jgi:hypothetical protein
MSQKTARRPGLDFDGIVAGLDSNMIGKNSEEMVKIDQI